MNCAIISDIHDNLINLDKFLFWSKKNKIKVVICCGDVTNTETLERLAGFSGEIHLVKGNAELYREEDLKKYPQIIYYGKVAYFEIDNVKIGACHELFLVEKVLEKGDCNFVFYGHTHKPWIKKKSEIYLLNPGTLAGMFQKATFAVLDTKTKQAQLKLLYE